MFTSTSFILDSDITTVCGLCGLLVQSYKQPGNQTKAHLKALSCLCCWSQSYVAQIFILLTATANPLSLLFFYFCSVNMKRTENCAEAIVRSGAPDNKKGWKKLGMLKMLQIGKSLLHS